MSCCPTKGDAGKEVLPLFTQYQVIKLCWSQRNGTGKQEGEATLRSEEVQ